MTFPYSEENLTSRRRLKALVSRLSAADLSRSTHYGWTIAALLAHLAFWDQRHLVLLHRWQENGVDPSPIDPDAINEALKPLCHAIDPHTAVELCLTSAESLDAELEQINPVLFDAIQATPTHYRFNRSLHRNGHLDDIEFLLQKFNSEGYA